MAESGQEPPTRSRLPGSSTATADTTRRRSADAGAIVPDRADAELADILDCMPIPVLALAADYRIFFANRAAEKLLGYRPGELAGVELPALSDAAAMQLSGLSRRRSPRQVLCRMQCKDGSSLQLRIDCRSLGRDGAGALLMLSEGREPPARPHRAPGTSQLATLGQIATGLAQELDQPINVIRMAADNTILMVNDGETDPKFLRGQLGLISGQSQRMARIVDHIRHFARIEPIEPVTFDVSESVRAALALMERDFRRSGIRTRLHLPDGPALAFGLPLRLEQVLINLFLNARDAILREPDFAAAVAAMADASDKAPPPPSVAGEVRIDLSVLSAPGEGQGCVEVRICDSGPGVPDRFLARIFDPFFTTKPAGTGTGLGLSICAALVADMGGSIAARNADSGAEFVVVMPVAPAPQAARPDPAPAR